MAYNKGNPKMIGSDHKNTFICKCKAIYTSATRLFRIMFIMLMITISGCNWDQIISNSQIENQASDMPSVDKPPKAEPILIPGEYNLHATKSNSSFIVYVPLDYSPDQSFPVIFCYHGAGAAATTWPFQQVTNGKGFIIAGMNYTSDTEDRTNLISIKYEKAFFLEALDMISARLNVNNKMIFMGGYSQGGYHTSLLGERLLDRLAGLIILGAGRYAVDKYPPLMKSIRGKPIFVGAGKNDTVHNPRARAAANVYQSWNASVTFEEWQGVGHNIDTPEFPSKLLLDWLNRVCLSRLSQK